MTTFPMLPPHHSDHVLVASPNSMVRQRVLKSLCPRASRVGQTTGGAEALGHLEEGDWQVLFLDRRLPDLDAEEVNQTVQRRYPAVKVVWLDNETTPAPELDGPRGVLLDAARESAGNDGDQDGYGSSGDRESSTGNDCAGDRAQFRDPDEFGCAALPGMIGLSAVMQPVYRMVQLVASRDTTVLITGPTGSGKELVARALHQLSPRAARTFAVVNCAAIPETLLEAELFGYSRGAFTGALQSYAGRIQAAHLGTLFLDEIGDMPLSLQPKLLRFLEQKELQRLGSSQVVRVDARVVSASNADLLTLVRERKFREDLYYRLSAFPVAIPPLRERPDDVVLLAAYFVKRLTICPPAPILSDEAVALLVSHRWPGNVRELQNVIERALVLAAHQAVIRPAHLMLSDASLRSCVLER